MMTDAAIHLVSRNAPALGLLKGRPSGVPFRLRENSGFSRWGKVSLGGGSDSVAQEIFRQRLKPEELGNIYGTAEAVPLSKTSSGMTSFSGTSFTRRLA